MADDGGKDILQLHFGIDINDVNKKIGDINKALGSIVTEYDSTMRKLKVRFANLFDEKEVNGEKIASPFDTYMDKMKQVEQKANSFASMNSRIRKELKETVFDGAKGLQDVESALSRIANLFDKGMNITNFRGLTETQGAFSQFAHAIAQFKSATLGKNSMGLDQISKEFEESVSRITKNWGDLRIALGGGKAWDEFSTLTAKSFSIVQDKFETWRRETASVGFTSYETLASTSKALKRLSELFLGDRLFGGEKFSRSLETQLQKGISQGLDTAYGTIATNLANLGEAVQNFPSGTEAKLQEFGRGLGAVTGALQNSEVGMNASSIVDLLNSAGSAVQIDGEQLAKNIEQKIQSVKVSINLKLNTNSITQADRDEANAALAKHPLSIPVEFVFENGTKRLENAAKAASQAAEKSMSFSRELEELKAYREDLNATAIDASKFREKLNSVYENLFPRRNKPSLADNELLPQADKLIAEMEDKAAKLADASAKATARQQLMIGGDAIEAFRVDAQAKLDAMKPLEFTNIRLKASTVDVSDVKEILGLAELAEKSRDMLKSVALPISQIDVSQVTKATGKTALKANTEIGKDVAVSAGLVSLKDVKDAINKDKLQTNFDALAGVAVPVSQIDVASATVNKVQKEALQTNFDLLAGIAVPVSQIDVGSVKKPINEGALQDNFNVLAGIAIPVSELDVSRVKQIDTVGLQERVDSLVKLTLPLTNLTFAQGVATMDTSKLQQNVNTLGDKVILPIYNADLTNIQSVTSGEDVAQKISNLANLVAYIQSVDLSKATITNADTLKAETERFVGSIKPKGIKLMFQSPTPDDTAAKINGILGSVRVKTAGARVIPLYFGYDALNAAGTRISSIVDGLQGGIKPLNVSIDVAASPASHTVIQNMVAEVNNIVTAIDTVPAAFAEMGKALNGEGIASPSNMKQIQDAFDKLAKAIDTVRTNFETMANKLGQKVSVPLLEQKDIDRMFSYAKAIKEIADSMKYLNKLQEMLASLDVTGKEVMKSAGRYLKDATTPSKEQLKQTDDIVKVSAELGAESVQAYYDEAAATKKKLEDKLSPEVDRHVAEAEAKAYVGYPMGGKERLSDALETQEKFTQNAQLAMGVWRSISDSMSNGYDFTEGFRSGIANVDSQTERFKSNLQSVIALANKAPGSMSEGFYKAAAEFKRLSGSIEKSKSDYNTLISAVKSGAFDIKGGGGMNIAGLDVTALKRLQAQMKTTGDSFTEMMRTMGFYISGRSVITFFQNAIKSASQFSMEIRRIQSLATTFDFDRIKTGLENLDARFGNLIHNAKALYWAFSSGVRGTEEELVRFTETMSKTAITIGSDVMPVMDAATTLMNAYGKSAASAGEISDLLFTIVKEGKANGQQLASSIGNIIAPASAMGLTFKDIGATISTLTRTMKTNNALTYLNNILAKMNNPTKEVQSQLDKLGLEINSTAIKAKGFAQVMREIHEATRGDINLIAKIFPDIRGQRAAVTLFSTQFGEFQKQLENFGNMAGNMDEALAKITDNPQAQFAALRNGFEMIRQAAGDAAINVITFGGALTPIFSAVNGMKSFGRSVAGHIAGLAALGVVMNMVGKAKLMLEASNISSIQQMNLAYNEQTKLIADSVLSQRQSLALREDARAKTIQQLHDTQLNANAEYQDVKLRLEVLSAQEGILKAQQEEVKTKLQSLKYDRDAVKNAEEIFVARQKTAMAYERMRGSFEARESIPEQWALNDRLSEAGSVIRNFKKETALMAYSSGLRTGDLQKIINAEIIHALHSGATEGELNIDAAAIARKAGIDAMDEVKNNILKRMVAESQMEALFSSANEDFKRMVKEGNENPEFIGTLTEKINKLNEDLQNRAQVAFNAIAELDAAYAKAGVNEAERKVMIELMLRQNGLLTEQAELEAKAARIEMSLGGPAYKMQLDASKALAQSLASESKIHEKNMMDIIRETDAAIKDAAAKRDMASAESIAAKGRIRLNDYIVMNNLQLGRQKTKLDELIQTYQKLETKERAWGKSLFMASERMRMNALPEQIAKQRMKQLGQFGGESGAWRGMYAAAKAGADNAQIPSILGKLSYLPGGAGAMLGTFVRPFSTFYKEIAKGSGLLAQAAMKAVKWTVAIKMNNVVVGRAIAQQQKLTATQALASMSISKYVGTLLSLPINGKSMKNAILLAHGAQALGIGAKALGTAMTIVTGSFAAAAVALGAVLWWASSKWDNSPFVKWMGKLTDLDRQLERSKGLDKLFDLVKQNIARKNEYEQRYKLLQEDADYSMKAYDALSRLNGIEKGVLAERQKRLGEYEGQFEPLLKTSKVVEATKARDSLATTYVKISERINELQKQIFETQRTQGVGAVDPILEKAVTSLRYRFSQVAEELKEANIALADAQAKARLIPASLVSIIEAYEMTNEIEMNRMDIIASESTNAMRVALLAKKRNDTERRIAALLEGKSDEERMGALSKTTANAYNAHTAAEQKLAELKINGYKEDSDEYKAQEKIVEDAEKALQNAQTVQDNFRNSYVNYRKKQVEQMQEQIKLDREMAELSRKMRSQQLDAEAYNGARGGNATAEKLALELKNSYELMGEEQRRIREINSAFFVRNAKGFIKGMGEDAKAVFGAWKSGDYSGVMQQSAAFVKSLGKTLASIDGALKSQDMQLPESRVLEIRKMQMDALKALTDFWQKVVTDMANIVKQSKNAIDDLQINRLREIMRGDRKLNPFDVNNTAAFQRQRGELGALQKKQTDLQTKYNAAVMDELKQRARIQNAEDAVADADMKRVDAAFALGDASRKVKEANDAVAWAGKQYSGALDALARDVHAGESTYHTGTLEAANAAKAEIEKRRESLEWAQSNERQAMFAVADAERRYADASDMLSKETARQTAEKSKAIKNEMDANAKAIAQKQNEIRQGSAMLRYREMERDLAMKRNAVNRTALAKRAADAALGFRRDELVTAKEEYAWKAEAAKWRADDAKSAKDAVQKAQKTYEQAADSVLQEKANGGVNLATLDKANAAYNDLSEKQGALANRIADAQLAVDEASKAEKAVAANALAVSEAEARSASANNAYAKSREVYTKALQTMQSKESMELQAQARREWILRNGTYEQKGGVLKGVLNSAIVRDQKLIAQMRGELAQGWYTDGEGNRVELDEAARAKRIAEINELSQSVRKNMDSYIDVQGDLVKRQQEARNGVLQLAQSLQKFRSVAVDAVDAMSSEAFSMRFRSFSGLKELPQMRTTTAEERSMNENMERRDEYFTELNKFLADYAQQNGADAQKQYAQAISGLATAANSFKTAAETFDKAVRKPLTVSVSYVDPFAR